MKEGAIISRYLMPPHPGGIFLAGNYVRLEPLDPDRHAEGLFAANALDAGGRNWLYLPYGPFGTLAEYRSWLDIQAGQDDPVFFSIITRSDNQPVGVASFLRINRADGSIEVGHINFSPRLQRSRAATEAMYLMMKWAFESGYRRYEWKCNALNLSSRKAAQRLGLSYEGVFRQSNIVKGRNRDTAWFAAIDKEWGALQACFETYLAAGNFDGAGNQKQALSALTQPILYKADNFELS